MIYRNASGTLGDLQYGYDATGNRTSVGGSFARTLLPDAVSTSTYDAANRQLAFGTQTMTFDDNGNLLTQTDPSGTLTYTWDARNRLTGLSAPSVNASFAYDGLGRRAQKTIGSVLSQFQYDGLDVVREIGGGGDASYLRTLSIDETLTRTDAVDTLHYLAGALGSTVALMDPTGNPTTTYTYEPYGRSTVAGAPSPNPFQFTGRENEGTGLNYYQARYYSPLHARFLTEDPLRLHKSANAYVYTVNNPLRLLDPLGLISTPSEIAAAQRVNSGISLSSAIASIPLGVAGFVESGVAAAALSDVQALSQIGKAFGALEGSNIAGLAGAATATLEGIPGVAIGIALDAASLAATAGSVGVAATWGAGLAAFAGGYGVGTLLYSTGYFDAVYAWDYYRNLLEQNALGTRARSKSK